MKDREIFSLLQNAVGFSADMADDYRPCNRFYADKLNIPHIPDAILVSLKNGGGQLIYIPERDTDGNVIERPKPQGFENMSEAVRQLHPCNTEMESASGSGKMKAKVVMQDGVVEGVLFSEKAVQAKLELIIVDADSEYDTQEAVREELEEPGMMLMDKTVTRHPGEGQV